MNASACCDGLNVTHRVGEVLGGTVMDGMTAAAWVQAFSAVVTVGATIVIVRLTSASVKEARRMADHMDTADQAAKVPRVVLEWQFRSAPGPGFPAGWEYVAHNIGSGVALNVVYAENVGQPLDLAALGIAAGRRFRQTSARDHRTHQR